MRFFLSTVAAALAVAGVTGCPVEREESSSLAKRQSTPNSSGTHDGFFFSWWSDGGAAATYTNLAGGSYSVQWSDGGNLVGGKGWKPGMTERYDQSKNIGGNANDYVGPSPTPVHTRPTATAISLSTAGCAAHSLSTTSSRTLGHTIHPPAQPPLARSLATAARTGSARAGDTTSRQSTALRPFSSIGLFAPASVRAAQ